MTKDQQILELQRELALVRQQAHNYMCRYGDLADICRDVVDAWNLGTRDTLAESDLVKAME